MITVEELIIQSLYYRLVVTKVLQTSPETVEENGDAATAIADNAATTICVANADDAVAKEVRVDTILDTGQVRLLRMTSSETQTDLLPVWCIDGGSSIGSPHMTSSPIEMSPQISLEQTLLEGAEGWTTPRLLKCLPTLNLSGLQNVNIIQLQDMRDDDRKMVAMFTQEPAGESNREEVARGGNLLDFVSPKIVTNGTCVTSHPVDTSGVCAAEQDSGIWDMLHGNGVTGTAALNALVYSPTCSRETSPKIVNGDDSSRTLSYKLYKVDETCPINGIGDIELAEAPVHECAHVLSSSDAHETLSRTKTHGGSVSSIHYSNVFDCDRCAQHACAVEASHRNSVGETDESKPCSHCAGRRHLSPPVGLTDAMADNRCTVRGIRAHSTSPCMRCHRRQSASSSMHSENNTPWTSEESLPAGDEVVTFERHTDWMRDLPEKVRETSIADIAIPGSHISLAIDRHMRTDMDFTKCNYEMASFLRRLPNLAVFNDFRARMKDIWKAWMPKQWLSVTDQLNAGIRYFDLKICKFRSAFYGEHGLYTRCFTRYLREMREFFDAHPTEVILLHFQPLQQLRTADKRRLLTVLFQHFGARLARCAPLGSVTLNSLRANRKQAIILFSNEDIPDVQNHIFAALVWPDTLVHGSAARERSVSGLMSQLDAVYDSAELMSNSKFHLTRAVLYADMSMVFGELRHHSMQEMTRRETTAAVSDWLTGKHRLNVVTVDFAGFGDVIGKVIGLNSLKKVHTTV